MLFAGIDTETTGVDEDAYITEIAVVLWDSELDMPVKQVSEIIKVPEGVNFHPKAVEASGINREITEMYGITPDAFLRMKITEIIDKADLIVAHNAKFDRKRVERFFRINFDVDFPEKPWLCTMSDLEHPSKTMGKSLMYLAAYYGFVNPFPHRAVADVLTMFKIMRNYDIEDALQARTAKTLTIVAEVSFDDKELAKAKDFVWTKIVPKKWAKKIKSHRFKPEEYEFPVSVYKEED